MIKNYIKLFIILLFSVSAPGVFAQTSATTSSPYSRYGIGDYEDPLLPQQRAMGGIAVAVRKTSFFNDINVVNPASYSAINLTTFDIGAYGSNLSLKSSTAGPENSVNFRLSHVAFAIPVSKHSALSFGLLPYANVGYNYSQPVSVKLNNGSSGGVDTSTIANHIYSGEGGMSKAYIGYGFAIGPNLNLGFNVSYIFGNERQYASTEFPDIGSALNTRIENGFSAGGINFDYGVQYNIKVSELRHFTLGYSGSSGSQINATSTFLVSQYLLDAEGNANLARDTIISTSTSGKLNLPMINRFGIAYQKDGKYMIGADYKVGQWSNLALVGVNSGLKNSQSLSVGGQYTPNIDAISSYLAVVDYRLGFNYDKTYLNVAGTNINQYSASFGLGLPIPNERRTSFYKVNFSAEIGRRGTLQNDLVQETFFNFHLGFAINDRWFQKYKFN